MYEQTCNVNIAKVDHIIYQYIIYNIYRVSQKKKTWTFLEIGKISLFIRESFRNFVW